MGAFLGYNSSISLRAETPYYDKKSVVVNGERFESGEEVCIRKNGKKYNGVLYIEDINQNYFLSNDIYLNGSSPKISGIKERYCKDFSWVFSDNELEYFYIEKIVHKEPIKISNKKDINEVISYFLKKRLIN